jgi:hypothetical protein
MPLMTIAGLSDGDHQRQTRSVGLIDLFEGAVLQARFNQETRCSLSRGGLAATLLEELVDGLAVSRQLQPERWLQPVQLRLQRHEDGFVAAGQEISQHGDAIVSRPCHLTFRRRHRFRDDYMQGMWKDLLPERGLLVSGS